MPKKTSQRSRETLFHKPLSPQLGRTHLFLLAASRESTHLLNPVLSSALCLPLVTASDDSMMSFNRLVWGSTTISTGSGKHSTPQNSRKPQKIKFESKGILVFFFLLSIPLQLQQTNKKIKSDWSKKKKESVTKSQNFPTTYHDIPNTTQIPHR